MRKGYLALQDDLRRGAAGQEGHLLLAKAFLSLSAEYAKLKRTLAGAPAAEP